VRNTGIAPPEKMGQSYVQMLDESYGHLDREFSTHKPHLQEISRVLMPRNGRFLASDRNKGQKVHNTIYDNTGLKAVKTARAGMLAGASSPARPWFALETADPSLNKRHAVVKYTSDVRNMMMRVMARTNTYGALDSAYGELLVFGTSATLVRPNFDKVFHCYPITAGQYRIASGDLGTVDTLFREFDMTVSQMVKEFGFKSLSPHVQDRAEHGGLQDWITVRHGVEPRIDRDLTAADNRNMPIRSTYWEKGQSYRVQDVLSISGFEMFPALVPRWDVSGGDVYGNGPGAEALGDTKSLQHQQMRKGQGIDYMVKPPIQVPNSMKGNEVDMLPGGINFVEPGTGQQAQIQSAWNVNINLSHLLEDIQDTRERIRQSFFADLFLMIAQADHRMTAFEVARRHEEKLLMLGPVLDRVHNELLRPLVDLVFHHMDKAGLLPPPPPELEGKELDIQFVSMLAQAQKAVQTQQSDRLHVKVAELAELKPNVIDKFDADSALDDYGRMLGVDPGMIVPTEDVLEMRAERANAEAAAAQSEAMAVQAGSAKSLAEAQSIAQINSSEVTPGI